MKNGIYTRNKDGKFEKTGFLPDCILDNSSLNTISKEESGIEEVVTVEEMNEVLSKIRKSNMDFSWSIGKDGWGYPCIITNIRGQVVDILVDMTDSNSLICYVYNKKETSTYSIETSEVRAFLRSIKYR